jgi:hypothetical protein
VVVKSLSCEDLRDFGVGQGATTDDIQAISDRGATPAYAKRPAAMPEWILQTHPSFTAAAPITKELFSLVSKINF